MPTACQTAAFGSVQRRIDKRSEEADLPCTLGRICALLCLAANLLPGLGTGVAHAQPELPAFAQEPFTHSQRFVAIAPTRRLNLQCTAHGAPVVILDPGWGGPTTAWAYVQPVVAGFTRICCYDRAGQGFSDPGPLPRDTDALVTDLHALLHAAGLGPPLCLCRPFSRRA